jgi:putative NADPH-quinone reductase
MKALIVYAHPEPHSMNAALKDAAVGLLQHHGVAVQVSDLYAQHFQPVASRDDFLQMENPKRLGYSHEQRHAAAGRRFSADIIAEQDKVAAADLLIFQFPLWWYSVPAILKGWADRVLSHGFAFTNELVFERGMLRGRRAMISVTTGGSAEELQADRRYTGTMDEFLKPFSGGVLRFVGLEVLPPHIAYAVATMDAEGRTRQIDTYRTMLRSALAT